MLMCGGVCTRVYGVFYLSYLFAVWRTVTYVILGYDVCVVLWCAMLML